MAKDYSELTFTDDFLFGKILCDDIELCREFTEIILDRKIAKISWPEKQKNLSHSADSKGVRLDVCFEDDKNTLYNIEMQTGNETDLRKRVRYYQSMIDMNSLQKGAYYSKLKDSVIVFICTFDLFKCGLRRYTFSNRCAEKTELELEDGALKVFINTKGSEDKVSPKLASLLRSMNGEVTDSELGNRIQTAVQKALERPEWRLEYMNQMIRDMDNREKGRREGHKEGKIEGRKEGRKEGTNMLTSMQQWLLNCGRFEDVKRTISDSVYRDQLLSEYAAANNLK